MPFIVVVAAVAITVGACHCCHSSFVIAVVVSLFIVVAICHLSSPSLSHHSSLSPFIIVVVRHFGRSSLSSFVLAVISFAYGTKPSMGPRMVAD